jgi:putative ABC transport system permease protein
MSLLSRLHSLARVYLRRHETEAADEEEVRFYLESLTEAKIRDGTDEDQARRAAIIEVGGIEQIMEQVRESRSGYFIESFARDINYARRSLGRSPGFTLVACLTIAFGVGFGGAIFSLVASILLKPLPYPDSKRLVEIRQVHPDSVIKFVSYPDYWDWRIEQRTFVELAAEMQTDGVFTGGEKPERISGRMVSANFFHTLGAIPELGRVFTEAEDAPGGERALVLGHDFWQRRFHSDRDVVGRVIEFNGEPWRVVGIMPPNFDFYGRINQNNDFFIPLGRMSHEPLLSDRRAPRVSVIGRIGEGVSLEEAAREMQDIGQRINQRHPESQADRRILLQPFLETYLTGIRPTLLALTGAVLLVVLIAFGTVANLMLSRGATRYDEIAMRLALGGSRVRVLCLLVAEAGLLCLGGTILGTLLAAAVLAWLRSLSIGILPRAEDAALNFWTLGLVVGLAFFTTVFFQSLPFFRFSAIWVRSPSLERARRFARPSLHHRLRRGVVVTQFGLSVMLLLTSSLLLKSFWHLTRVNPGYDRAGVLTLQIVLPPAKYSSLELTRSFFEKTIQRVRALPGVEAVSISTGFPMGRSGEAPFRIEGQPQSDNSAQWPKAYILAVSHDYHRTLQIPLLAGRYFHPDETKGLIVDQIFAQEQFPGAGFEHALGQGIKLPDDDAWREIVGVVGSVRHDRLDRNGPGVLYLPWTEIKPASRGGVTDMCLLVKAGGAVANLPAKIEAVVRGLDQNQPIGNVATLESLIRASYAPKRLNSGLLGSFSLVALILAAIGCYGVLSYTVAQRAHDIGIRVALGARRRHIMGKIVGEGLGLAIIGATLGVSGALLIARLLQPLLYDVPPDDLFIYGSVLLAFLVVALLATLGPALRAAKIDPAAVLRCE